MKRSTRIAVVASVAVVALGTAGVVAVSASTDNEVDTPIAGPELERASAAALAHTEQGRVTGTEAGDEESYYEIEVTLDNGSQVDVQLDKDFQVVDSTADSEDDSSGQNESD